MTDQLKRVLLKNHKRKSISILIIALLLSVQLTNIVLLKLLGLNDHAYPWTFIIVLRHGFITPALLAIAVITIPILGGWLWLQGGVKRAIAQYMLISWLIFILLDWLGLYVFVWWDGLTDAPYPWQIYRLFMQLPSSSESFNHLLISMMGSFSLFFIVLVFKCFSTKTNAEKVFGHAHFSNAFEIQHAGLFSHEGIVLGHAYGKLLRSPGYEGVLVVAPTGGGKTSAIAIPNLLEWPHSGVFNDLKGELYQLTAKHRESVLENECYRWAPADPNKKTKRYNPFFYVSQNPDLRIRDLQLIAETLIPATKLGDGFWYQSSREILVTLSLYLLETKGVATLSEIHDLSKQEHFFSWLLNEISIRETHFSKQLIQNTNALLSGSEETQKNILKDFHARMGLFNDPLVCYATSGNDFDFRNLRRKKMSLYIHITDADKERLSPILTLFWAQLINVVAHHAPKEEEPYGILALMDEFGNMARINKLKEGLSFLRSYRFRPIIIVQYLGQLFSTYGREDAKGFLNTKIKIVFALNDIDDATFFSKSLGTKTVKITSGTVSTGHGDNPGSRSCSISYRARALMTPDEIMQMPKNKEIILIEARNPIKANKCYWFKEAKYLDLLNNKK